MRFRITLSHIKSNFLFVFEGKYITKMLLALIILIFFFYQFQGRVSIPIADVISVKPTLPPLPSSNNNNCAADNVVQGQQQQPEYKQFTVVYAKRCGQSANANKWRHHAISLHNTDFRIVNLWIRTLQAAIQGEFVVF